MRKLLYIILVILPINFFAQTNHNFLEEAVFFEEDGYQCAEYDGLMLKKKDYKTKFRKVVAQKFVKRKKLISDGYELVDSNISNDSIVLRYKFKKSKSPFYQKKIYLVQTDRGRTRVLVSMGVMQKANIFYRKEIEYSKKFLRHDFKEEQSMITYNSKKNRIELGDLFEEIESKRIIGDKTCSLVFTNRNNTDISLHWEGFSSEAMARLYIQDYLKYKWELSASKDKEIVKSKINFFGKERDLYSFLPNKIQENGFPLHTNQLILVTKEDRSFVIKITNHMFSPVIKIR